MDSKVKALVFPRHSGIESLCFWDFDFPGFPGKSIFTSDRPFHPLCSRTPISPSCLRWQEPPTRLEAFSALTWTSPKITLIPTEMSRFVEGWLQPDHVIFFCFSDFFQRELSLKPLRRWPTRPPPFPPFFCTPTDNNPCCLRSNSAVSLECCTSHRDGGIWTRR